MTFEQKPKRNEGVAKTIFGEVPCQEEMVVNTKCLGRSPLAFKKKHGGSVWLEPREPLRGPWMMMSGLVVGADYGEDLT